MPQTLTAPAADDAPRIDEAPRIHEADWAAWLEENDDARRLAQFARWWNPPALRQAFYQRLAEPALGGRVRLARRPGPAPAAPAPTAPASSLWLVTGPQVLSLLRRPELFSNAPYRALSASDLMLASDAPGHTERRQRAEALLAGLALGADEVDGFVQATMAQHLRPQRLCTEPGPDLVELAKDVVMDYFLRFLGLPASQREPLETVFDGGYGRLNHLLVGRHLGDAAPPSIAPDGFADVGRLIGKTLLGHLQQGAGAGLIADDPSTLLARLAGALRRTEPPERWPEALPPIAGLVVEMLGGAYGQAVTAVCKSMLRAVAVHGGDPEAPALAGLHEPDRTRRLAATLALMAEDPPAPILNRTVLHDHEGFHVGDELMLALDALPIADLIVEDHRVPADRVREARVFGHGVHRCLGRGVAPLGQGGGPGFPDMITPLIGATVSALLKLQAEGGRLSLGPLRLKWGGLCEALPMHWARVRPIEQAA